MKMNIIDRLPFLSMECRGVSRWMLWVSKYPKVNILYFFVITEEFKSELSCGSLDSQPGSLGSARGSARKS